MQSKLKNGNALALGALMTFQSFGCGTPEQTVEIEDRSAEAVDTAASLEGEELFREILFPNAESAKRVPELARLYEYSGTANDAEQEAMEVVQDLLIAGIADLDPEFFERFRSDITSGDPRRVKAMLEESSLLLGESLRDWGAGMDELLSEKGMGQVGESLSKDEKLKKLARLSAVDPLVLERIAEVMREQLVPGLPGEIILDVDLAKVQHLINPVVVDVSRQLDHQLTFDKVIKATTVQLDNNFAVQLDHQATFDRVTQAVVLENQFALDNQLNLDRQLVKIGEFPAKATDIQLAEIGAVGDVTVEVETAVYAVVAVAVAVVAVAVAVFGRPVDGAAYLNGDQTRLFQDQLVANVTRVYAGY